MVGVVISSSISFSHYSMYLKDLLCLVSQNIELVEWVKIGKSWH
jgi:hypothetical protein